MTGRDDTSSQSVGKSSDPSLVSGVMTPTLMIKLKNMKRRSRASPVSLENEQTPKKRKRLRFRKISSSSLKKNKINKKDIRLLNDNIPDPLPHLKPLSSPQINRLTKRAGSLKRTNGLRRSASPKIGTDELKHDEQQKSSSKQSPVMLIRRRSSTRSIRGSPIRRFFRRLFRRRSKIKYYFSKSQLRRQLSFEIRESPDKVTKYEVKSLELLSLSPRLRRKTSSEIVSSNNKSPIIIANITKPKSEVDSHSEEVSSTGRNAFKSFDYDYRDRLENQYTRLNQNPEEAAKQRHRVMQEIERKEIMGDEDEDLEVFPGLRPGAENFQRKRTLDRSRTTKSKRTSSQRSNQPIIRRIDLYDNPNPAVQLGFSDTGSMVSSTASCEYRQNEQPIKVDEALAFVDTWSSYLRRAIAIRVVLRQEIHSLEVREEQEWKNRISSHYISSADDSSYTESTKSSTSPTSSSKFTVSSNTRNDSQNLQPSSKTSSKHHSPKDTGQEQLEKHIDASSGIYNRQRQYAAVSQTTMSKNSPSLASSSLPSPQPDEKVSSIQQSLAQGRIYEKYSALMRPSTSSAVQGVPSNSNLSIPELMLPGNISQVRSSSDSLISLAKRDREGAWFKGTSQQQQRIVSSNAAGPRPLPPLPVIKQRERVRSEPMLDKYGNHQQRKMSDQILQDMYQELEELQQRSAQLSRLVKNQRDSAISTTDHADGSLESFVTNLRKSSGSRHQRIQSIDFVEHDSSESAASSGGGGAALTRGRLNRRETQIKVYWIFGFFN